MNFDGRQAVQGFHHSLVCKFERIIDGFTFDEFCRHRTSSNCGATSERFKCHICDDIVFTLIYIRIMSPQRGFPTSPTPLGSFISPTLRGICKMIHDFSLYAIKNNLLLFIIHTTFDRQEFSPIGDS